MKENYSMKDAFKELNILTESEAFRINDEKQRKALDDFIKGDDYDDFEMIVDIEAEDEEDLKDSYIDNVIIECPTCRTKFYKTQEELIPDEEQPEYVNVDEECAVCNSVGGFKIIGKVAPYSNEEEEEVTPEDEVADTEAEPEIEEEPAVEEEPEVEEENEIEAEPIEGEENPEVEETEEDKEEVEESLNEGKLGGAIGAGNGSLTGTGLGAAAGAAIGHAVAPGVGTALGGAIGAGVGNAVGTPVGALVGDKVEDKINEEKCINRKPSKKLKEFYEPLSSFKSFEYLDQTNQGHKIVKIYHDLDDDRLHVIVKRERRGDFAVGLGYTPDGGHWNQGWYDFESFEDAEKALKAEYNVEEYIHEPKVEEAVEDKKELKGKELAQAFIDLYKEAGDNKTGAFGEKELTVGSENEVVFESQMGQEIVYFNEDGSIKFVVDSNLDDWGIEKEDAKAMFGPTVKFDEKHFTACLLFANFNDFVSYVKEEGFTNYLEIDFTSLNESLLGAAAIGTGLALGGGAIGAGIATSGIAKGIGSALGEEVQEDEKDKYLSETIAGSKIVKIYRDLDDDRLHVIVKSEFRGHYDVVLGYTPDDGCWNQGWYDFNSFEDAEKALKARYNVEEYIHNHKPKVEVEKAMEDFNKEDFMENGKELNNDLSYDGEYDLSFEEYCNHFEKEDVENHRDLIEELYEDYLNLVEDMRDDYDEFDEQLFEQLVKKYIKETYDNIGNFKTTKVGLNKNKNKLVVEGILSLKNGKKGNSKFVFESIEKSNKKVSMIGYNETFSKTKKAFKLVCGLKESKLSPKVLNYNYSAKSLNESKRVSGRVILK